MFHIPRVGWAIAIARPNSTPCTTRFFRHTATTSNLDASPTQGPGATKRRPSKVRALRTLDPHRIQPQDFIDVSNYTRPRVKFRSHDVILSYRKTISGNTPFPPNSHGFLYYHHDPKLPVTTGEVRLRLTAGDDPAGFHKGEDLVGVHGGLWAISLLTMTKAYYEPFRILLLEDGLFDSDLMRVIQAGIPQNNSHLRGTYVHYLEQAFVLDVARAGFHSIRVFTPGKMGLMMVRSMFVDRRKKYRDGLVPYSGRILVRFERSTLPQHVGTRSLVLRVLDILEPIKAVIPGYDMHLPVPKEGGLVETHHGGPYPGSTPPRPWSINLDRPVKSWKDIGLLYPGATTEAGGGWEQQELRGVAAQLEAFLFWRGEIHFLFKNEQPGALGLEFAF
ncbi:hypothetical protein FPV67DRAFT_1480389 [Lyophyllum atratum]|nr:hypothetical protein FPV67DRAFT_1480389 [Lyophyllum atratum]